MHNVCIPLQTCKVFLSSVQLQKQFLNFSKIYPIKYYTCTVVIQLLTNVYIRTSACIFSGATTSSGFSAGWISFLGPVGLATGGFHFLDDYKNFAFVRVYFKLKYV